MYGYTVSRSLSPRAVRAHQCMPDIGAAAYLRVHGATRRSMRADIWESRSVIDASQAVSRGSLEAVT